MIGEGGGFFWDNLATQGINYANEAESTQYVKFLVEGLHIKSHQLRIKIFIWISIL